jgi:hypothetical protein
MAATKKAPRAAPSSSAADSTHGQAELRLFHDGGGRHENFSFTRAYWTGDGERESILDRINKKIDVIRSEDGQVLARAAKVDLLLPPVAPQEYTDIEHLVRRYEEMLPPHELNAFAQVTIRFPDAPNLHQPWELVRDWAKLHYARRVPVILVLHAPHLAGSPNPGHVHCIALCRSLTMMGWAHMERAIASDAGQREAYESWTAFQQDWSVAPG